MQTRYLRFSLVAAPVVAGGLFGYLLASNFPMHADRRDGQAGRELVEMSLPVDAPIESPEHIAEITQLRTLAEITDKEILANRLTVGGLDAGTRNRELVFILHRLSDLDARFAVRRSVEIDVGIELMTLSFRRLAEVDLNAALEELKTVADSFRRRELSLAILDLIGDRANGLERIYSSFPVSEAVMIRRDVIARRAETDPVDALLMAIEWTNTSDTFGRLALSEVARVAARLDPRSAMANAIMIPDGRFAAGYRSVLANEWSRLDPLSYLAYLESAPLEQLVSGDFEAVAAVDAERLLKVAEALPPLLGGRAQQAAFGALAEQDMASTLVRIEDIPPGRDRDAIVGVVAEVYGGRDIYAALEWARSQYRPASVMQSAVRGLATVDGALALDIAADQSIWQAPRDSLFLYSLVSSSISASGDASGVIERLRALGDEALLSQAVQHWSRYDVDAAITWSMTSINQLQAGTIQDLAATFALSVPEQAKAQPSSIGPGQREAWIRGVATGLSYNDGEEAMGWLTQFQAESFYDDVAIEVLQRWSNQMPESGATLLLAAPLAVQRELAAIAGRAWARTAPEAAAAWALNLDDRDAQVFAMGSVVASWSLNDQVSAQRWLDEHVFDAELRRRIEEQSVRHHGGNRR